MSGNESMQREANTTHKEDENVGSMDKAAASTEAIPDTASTVNATTSKAEEGSAKLPTLPIDACPKPNLPVPNENANQAKRVIRKVMVIDPKKLQQAGLDRKLAEAIGRQKLKTLAEDQKKKQDLSAKQMKQSSTASTDTTTAATKSFQVSQGKEVAPLINKTKNPKNVLLRPPEIAIPTNTAEVAESSSLQQQVIKSTISNPAESNNTTVIARKVIVTPNIASQLRLENVKHMLQHKILKKQLESQDQQPISKQQSPKFVEPKIEEIEIEEEKPLLQPSPVKTPQDIARVLDFDTKATATTSATSTVNAEHTNYMKSSDEVARLIARFGTVTNPLHKSQTNASSSTITTPTREQLTHTNQMPSTTIPKATIKCEKLPMDSTHKKPPRTKPTTSTTTTPTWEQLTHTNQMPLPTIPKATIKCDKLALESTHKKPLPTRNPGVTIPKPNKMPTLPTKQEATKCVTQKHDTEVAKGSNFEPPNFIKQSLDQTQFKNFPLYSPLKQPFPVVTHSQDLPLPTIATFSRAPFPTSLIRIGEMEQSQNNATQSQHNSNNNLVVLENKVLTQDERIDLTGLALETPKIASVMSLNNASITDTSAAPVPQSSYSAADYNVVPQTTASNSSSNLNPLPTDGAKLNNRTILSMNKVKLSTQQITALVKAINANKTNAPKQFVMIRKTSQKSNEGSSELGSANSTKTAGNTHMLVQSPSNLSTLYANTTFGCIPKTLTHINQDQIANIPEMQLPQLNPYARISYGPPASSSATENHIARGSYVSHENLLLHNLNASMNYAPQQKTSPPQDNAYTQAQNTCMTTLPNKFNISYTQDDIEEDIKPTVSQLEMLAGTGSQFDTEVQFKNPLPCPNKSSASAIDSGDESDPSISAVDFIASLAAAHPITEETKLELSPEELNLNASFSKNFSPLRIPSRNRTDSIKSEGSYEPYNITTGIKMQSTEISEANTAGTAASIGKIITLSEEDILKAVNATQQEDKEDIPKRSKNIVYNPASLQQQVPIYNVENVNNFDMIKTERLAETKVGPIIVKNIEYANMHGLPKVRTVPVILPNSKNSSTTSSEYLSETETKVLAFPTKNNTLPIKIESEEEFQIKEVKESKKLDGCEVSNTAHSKTAVIKETKTMALSGAEMPLTCKESNCFVATSNTEAPRTSNINQKQFETTSHLTGVATQTRTSAETRSLITENTDEKVTKGVEEEALSTAPKRLPRLMKGKINLVQRRKTPANMQEMKKNTVTGDDAVAQQKEIQQTSILEIEDVEGANVGNKIVEEATENTVMREENNDSTKLVKVTHQENTATCLEQEKLVGNANNASLLVTEQKQCDKPSEFASTTSLLESGDSKSKTAKITELLNPHPKKPKQKSFENHIQHERETDETDKQRSHNILLEAIIAPRQETLLSSSQIPFKQTKEKSATTAGKSSLLEPGDLKRKTATIAELLNPPPKKSKQKSFKEHIQHENDTDETEKQRSHNILLEAIIAPRQETLLSPPTIPFKKSKGNVIADETQKTGIQHLLTKFIKDKPVKENKAELTQRPIKENEDKLVEVIEVDESSSDSVQILNTEMVTENPNATCKGSKQMNKTSAEESSVDSSQKIPKSKTEQETSLGSVLGEECKLQRLAAILNISANNKNNETAKTNEITKDCDIINSNASKADAKNFQNNQKGGEKLTHGFLGFDHSSKSLQSIDSSLQHLITITNSAEKTKTCEKNFSIAERESPHDTSNNGCATKSWLTTDKPISKLATEGKASLSRRSVPLKKRWEALPRSEDDIEISDDLTPEYDDDGDYGPNYDSTQVTLKILENEIGEKEKDDVFNSLREGAINEKIYVKGNPGKALETINRTKEVLNSTQNQARIRQDSRGRDQINETVKNYKNISSTPSKRTQIDEKSKNISAPQTEEISTEPIESPKSQSVAINIAAVEGYPSTFVSMDHVEITNEIIPKAKAKRTPKGKLQKESHKLNQMANKVATAGTIATCEALQIVDKDGTAAKKRGGRRRNAKVTIEDETNAVNSQDNNKTLTIGEKRTHSYLEKSPSLPGVLVKEEFVLNSSELVVPSLNEMEAEIQTSDSENMDLLKVLETSTPTAEQNTSKRISTKRKTLGDLTETVSKKSRIRDVSSLNDDDEENSILMLNVTDVTDSVLAEGETPIKVPKKRGRKPKVVDPAAKAITKPETPTEPKKRGRKAKIVDGEGDFNGRLLLITKRTQFETNEVLTEEPMPSTSNKNTIQCGLCLKEMARHMWLEHLSTHYGVGWIVGEMPPIHLNWRSEVLKTMIAYLKTTEGKYALTCRMCQKTYKSALGTLQHIEVCGATDSRQVCDYCNVDYAKSSISIHMRVCAQKMALSKTVSVEEDEDVIKEPVLNNVGRRKRASVQKAEKIIKAIGDDKNISSIVSYKDAKQYVKFVAGTQHITNQWIRDLESLGQIQCPMTNCTFVSQDLATMQTHFKNCEFKKTPLKGVYMCMICTNSTETYPNANNAQVHVFREHKNMENTPAFEAEGSDCEIKTDEEISDDEVGSSGVDSSEECSQGNVGDSESEAVKRVKKKKINPRGIKTYPEKVKALQPFRDYDYSNTAMRLWAEFKSQQYSTQPLFTDINVNFNICSLNEIQEYLQKSENSMKFHFDSQLKLSQPKGQQSFGKSEAKIKWLQLPRLGVVSENAETLVFIGEAIKVVEWVPLPADIKEQYLLVVTRRGYTRKKNPKTYNSLLWLYKAIPAHGLGPLKLQLHYAIKIPDGPVHCLAFLPSGGYDANANRLGLVAMGSTTSTIKVYALPLVVSENEKGARHATTVNLEPVWLLTLDLNKPHLSAHPLVDTQCKTLCWSEFSGHTQIFAGYANGCISYWNVTCEMNLNRFIINDVPNYVPINFFYTRERNINAMAIHYDSSGVRLLAVALDRRLLYIYDIYMLDTPLLLKDEIARNEILDMEWSPLWQNVALAASDAFPTNGRSVYATSPTNNVFKNETIEKLNGAVTQIHYNPTQHILANATDTGDLVLLNLREMHFREMMSEAKGHRAVAIMDMKCLDGTDIPKFDPKCVPEDWSYYEKNCKEKYGLVFGPIEKALYKKCISEERRPPISLIPCTRINSLRCNKNDAGNKLLALGYENGFLRVLNIDRKSYFD